MATVEQILALHAQGYSKDEVMAIVNSEQTASQPTEGATEPTEGTTPTEGATEPTEGTQAVTTPIMDMSKVDALKKSIDALVGAMQTSNRHNATTPNDVTEQTENVTDILSKMFK